MDGFAEFWRDDRLPYVESRRACHSRACYRPHAHPTFSIGAVDGGSSVFNGAGPEAVRLRPGMLVVVPPSRVHACNPEPDRVWSYQMLHLDPIWVDEAVQASGVGQVRQSIVIVDDTEAYRRFCQLNALLFSDADPQLKEVSLTEFVCDTMGGPAIRAESPSALEATYRRLEPVLDMLRGEESGVVSLATLAEQAGMSRYQLIRAFRATTGMTPHAWHLNHRINLAREHLCAGADLARLAHSLGFADQSHFQRMFKAHAGVTPRRYRS